MNFEKCIKHIKDIGYNTIAFGIYIIMQQIIIMPILSKICNDIEFSKVILFISIFNIISMVIGDELGNTRLVCANNYKNRKFYGDFHLILIVLISAFVIISLSLNSFLKINWLELLVYLLIIIFGIIRYFSLSYLKLKQIFNIILIANIIYSLGALAGIYFAINDKFFLAPFFIGEFISLIYVLYISFIDKDQKLNLHVSLEFKKTIVVYFQLGTVSLIINLINYFDRIIILPLLGSKAMAIYYCASTIPKIMAFIINPLTSVFLAKLSLINDGNKGKIANILTKWLLPGFLIITLLTVILSFFGIMILYPNYYKDTVLLLLPISIANSFATISNIIKPIIMRFYDKKLFLYTNISYACIFCISMYFFSSWWGIMGFALAGCLARFTQFLTSIFMIIYDKTERRVGVQFDA